MRVERRSFSEITMKKVIMQSDQGHKNGIKLRSDTEMNNDFFDSE